MTTEQYVEQINNNPVIKIIRDAYKDISFDKPNEKAKDLIKKKRCEQRAKEASAAERRRDHYIMTCWEDFANITEKILRNPLMSELQKMQKISIELLRTQGLVDTAKEDFYDELWNIWQDELDIDTKIKVDDNTLYGKVMKEMNKKETTYSVGDEINEEFLYGPDKYDEELAKEFKESEE